MGDQRERNGRVQGHAEAITDDDEIGISSWHLDHGHPRMQYFVHRPLHCSWLDLDADKVPSFDLPALQRNAPCPLTKAAELQYPLGAKLGSNGPELTGPGAAGHVCGSWQPLERRLSQVGYMYIPNHRRCSSLTALAAG